jgi:hypothetical protein
MSDLAEFLLDILLNLVDVFGAWRFFVCLLSGIALAGFVYWQVANRTVCLALSIPLVLMGIAAGLFWEYRW